MIQHDAQFCVELQLLLVDFPECGQRSACGGCSSLFHNLQMMCLAFSAPAFALCMPRHGGDGNLTFLRDRRAAVDASAWSRHGGAIICASQARVLELALLEFS